ncbi:MAG: hypothetical protein ACWA5R_07265 [bacterium]
MKHLFIRLAFVLLLASQSASAISITSSFTGAWYDPASSGQGFSIEVVDTDSGKTLVIYWYTFDTDGTPLWLLGQSAVKDESSVDVDLYQVSGGAFGAGFDPQNISSEFWGSINIDFTSCSAGEINFSAQKERFGTGRIPLERITNVFADKCSGGISDDVTQGGTPIEIINYLNNIAAQNGASTKTDFEQRSDRTEFTLTLRDLPLGNYEVWVNEVQRGTVAVESTPIGNEGRIRYRSPQEEGKELLDFDPRNKQVDIRQGGAVLLSSTLPVEDNTPDIIPTDTPEFGNAEYEYLLNNVQAPASSHAEGYFEQRPDRVDFKVEVDDVALGTYEVFVGGVSRGSITPTSFNGENEGHIEFRYPIESGKELLDFDPRGKALRIELNGVIFFDGTFPTVPENEFGNGDDGSGNGDGNGDGGGDGDGDGDGGGDGGGTGGAPPFGDSETNLELTAGTATGEAHAEAELKQESDRVEFKVNLEEVPAGNYPLFVAGIQRGTIDVESFSGGTEGEIQFRTPQDGEHPLLDFDPRGEEIRIEDNGQTLFSGQFPQ